MGTSIQELGYLGFQVSNMPRWEAFATKVLGLDVNAGPRNSRCIRMDAAPARFILQQGKRDDLAWVGWKVASTAELDKFAQRVKSKGLESVWGSDEELEIRHAERMLHFADPEGTRHEAYVESPELPPPFHSELVTSGFVTGPGGLGHYVCEADHYAEMISFVNEILGVRLSDHIYLQPAPGVTIEASFFHANERHHSIAVVPRPPMPDARKHIHHFMVEVGTVSDVGQTRDRCLSFGLPVVMDIGQHPNDRMISFYARTPSGFLFEVGWGGAKVDDATWKAGTYDRISLWGHRPYGVMPGEAPVVPPGATAVA